MTPATIVLMLAIGGAILYALSAASQSQTGAGSTPAPPPSQTGGAALSSTVQAIAQAIATAEGYYVGPGVIPYDRNNPGDIRGSDGQISTYSSAADGWNALYNQINLILSGQSHNYTPDMTIAQIAQIYTGADNASSWASTVASQLGVSVDTPISEVSA